MSNSYFTKLVQRAQATHSQVDAKHFIYTHSKWLDEEQEVQFHILLTTNNQSYKGTTKFAELRNAAEDLDQPYEEFYDECKKALSTDMGLAGFDYELSCNEDPPLFKLHKCQGFETLYMEVELRKISNCFQLLDAAIELASTPQHIGKDIIGGGTSNTHSETLAEYKQYVEDSKNQETKLLKKFILLINSKKSRIEELERQLEALDQKADETDEYMADTDVEPEEGEKADSDFEGPTQAQTQRSQATTSKARAQCILDDTVNE